MKEMKTWILLVSLVLLLALVSAFVGVACWHMAYEEATFQGTIKEQRALEAGRTWCKEFVGEILNQQSEQLRNIQEAHKQKKKVNVGVLGLNIYGINIVKEAVADIMKDNLSNYYFEVITSLQSNKSLIDEAQELSQLLEVKVFVGPETESDLKQLIVWARTRPHPRPFVVFITPALVKDDTDINKQDNDSHAVIRMHMPTSASLKATFSLIKNQNISKVLAMTSTFDELNDLQVLKDLETIEVKEIVTGEFTPVTQSKEALENAVIASGVSDGKTGLLITKNYMFEQLSQISNPWLFSLPWFTSVGGILHDPTLKNYEFFGHPNFSLNYALFTGNSVRNKDWHSNVSLKVVESGLYTASDSNYVSIILAPVYDSVIVATHVGSWLSHEEIELDALSRRISWESSLWAGMSGLLKIRYDLERDFSKYLSLQLSKNASSQFLQYPSGIWNVLGDLKI